MCVWNVCQLSYTRWGQHSWASATNITHAYMWRDVFICDAMCLYVSNTSVYLHTNNRTTFASFYNQYGLCICVTRHICMCGMTPPCVCRAPRQISFMTVTWLIHTCDMSHLCVWHDSCICVTWRIWMSDMSLSYARHDSGAPATRPIQQSNMTHTYVWHD